MTGISLTERQERKEKSLQHHIPSPERERKNDSSGKRDACYASSDGGNVPRGDWTLGPSPSLSVCLHNVYLAALCQQESGAGEVRDDAGIQRQGSHMC